MDITQAVEGLKQHLEAFAASAQEKLAEELPVLAAGAQQLAGNPVVAALASAVHINDAPDLLATIADIVTKADAALVAQHAAGTAEGQQQAAAASQPPA